MRIEHGNLKHDLDVADNNYIVFTGENSQHFLEGDIYYVYDYDNHTNVLYLDEENELFFEVGYEDDCIAIFTTHSEATEYASELEFEDFEEEEEEEYDRIYKVGSYVTFATDDYSINYKVTNGMIIPSSETLECWDYIYTMLDIESNEIESFGEQYGVHMTITEDFNGYHLDNDEDGESTDTLINLLLRECTKRRSTVLTIDTKYGHHVTVTRNLSPKEMLYNTTDLDSLKVEKLTIY